MEPDASKRLGGPDGDDDEVMSHPYIRRAEPPKTAHKKVFQAGCCGRAFKRQHHLTRHLQLETCPNLAAKKKVLQAGCCGRAFKRQHHLKYHLQLKICPNLAAEKKKFVCGVCGTRFSSGNAMRTHKNKKHIIGRVECDKCSKTLYCHYTYLRHVKLVHGKKSKSKLQHLPSINTSSPNRLLLSDLRLSDSSQ